MEGTGLPTFIVIVLTVSPPKLRGHLTRWLFEISPGVYVGKASDMGLPRRRGDDPASGKADNAKNNQKYKPNS